MPTLYRLIRGIWTARITLPFDSALIGHAAGALAASSCCDWAFGEVRCSKGSTKVFWTLASIVSLLVIACCATSAVWFRQRREIRRREAEAERFSRWKCPNCNRLFGRSATMVQYGGEGDPCTDIQGEPFTAHVVICCSHCSFLNVFDEAGRAEFGPGVFYDPEQTRRDEERWERLAAELACPRCGEPYAVWSGIVWGDPAWPLGERAPVMCCPRCGAEGWVLESARGPQFAGVRFQDRWWKA